MSRGMMLEPEVLLTQKFVIAVCKCQLLIKLFEIPYHQNFVSVVIKLTAAKNFFKMVPA